MNKALDFCKKNVVLLVAFIAAAITSLIIPPTKEYINYFDFKTLVCLFCVLSVVCALKNVNFFYILAQKIVKTFKTTRGAIVALVYITFIGSMFIANDMALLTFLPLGYYVLSSTDKGNYMSFTFIMQNIAANLGGMLTPFGNPQNLFLYTKFNIPTLEFVKIMLLPFIISVTVITACCMFVENDPLKITNENLKGNKPKTIVYLMLFAYSIAIVFRTIPYISGLFVIIPVLLIMDRKALKMVDYPLLLTFVFFFIFAGNMSKIEIVQKIFSYFLNKSTLLFSVLSCQLISNVPSAILLSQFTDNYPDLLIGVNIGGVGTLIASLASLITFREYVRHNPNKSLNYIGKFSIYNFGFLFILIICQLLFR